MEELEITLALLSELFHHADDWVLINRTQFETILHAFTNHTLKLFKTKVVINSEFSPVTAYEKALNEIYASYDALKEKSYQLDASPSGLHLGAMKSGISRFQIDHRHSAGERDVIFSFHFSHLSLLFSNSSLARTTTLQSSHSKLSSLS